MRLFVTCALLCALAPAAAAQDSLYARRMLIGLLGDHMDRRDQVISPGEYGGTLWGARIGYLGDWSRHRTSTFLEVHTGTLSGSMSNGSSQQVWDAKLTTAWLRPSRLGFLGAELSARASVFENVYGSGGFSEDYGFEVVSLGPAIDWDHGRWRVRGSVPLVSLVARPYTRLNAVDAAMPLRVAGPFDLRAASLDVSHTSSSAGRVALRTAYTLDVQSLARDYGLATVDNRVSATLLWRFGRAR